MKKISLVILVLLAFLSIGRNVEASDVLSCLSDCHVVCTRAFPNDMQALGACIAGCQNDCYTIMEQEFIDQQ